MTRNQKILIIVSALVTVGSLGAASLVDNLPSGPQEVVGIALLIIFFWVYFDLIVKIIYRLAGVPRVKKSPAGRLTHRQADLINRYWLVWLMTSVLSGLSYSFLLNRESWKAAVIVCGALSLIILVNIFDTRRKIRGYDKKELFQ